MSELDLRRKYNYWEGSDDPICNRGDLYEVEEDLEDEDQSVEEMAVPEEEDES